MTSTELLAAYDRARKIQDLAKRVINTADDKYLAAHARYKVGQKVRWYGPRRSYVCDGSVVSRHVFVWKGEFRRIHYTLKDDNISRNVVSHVGEEDMEPLSEVVIS
jgi:hypothetical protein